MSTTTNIGDYFVIREGAYLRNFGAGGSWHTQKDILGFKIVGGDSKGSSGYVLVDEDGKFHEDIKFYAMDTDVYLTTKSYFPIAGLPRIIGVSGKAGSGKDEFSKILNELTGDKYTVMKFATILKKFVANILGVTVSKLEDRTFKEKKLGPEWSRWCVYSKDDEERENVLYITSSKVKVSEGNIIVKERLTPRKIMLLIGTGAGRDIIHPDIWVNALWATYAESETVFQIKVDTGSGSLEQRFSNKEEFLTFHRAATVFPEDFSEKRMRLDGEIIWEDYAKEIIIENYWVITDVRFPNELSSVEKRKGLTVRMDREMASKPINHPSETALDNYKFDKTIHNNGSIEDLTVRISDIFFN